MVTVDEFITCINCKMRKHKHTQVCCSCILLNSWCGYVQKLSIQMKRSQQETVFLRIFPHFQMQQPSCLSSDNLREKQASHLHCRVTGRVTSAVSQNHTKDLRKIIFWHLYSFTKKQQHMLQPIQMTVSKMICRLKCILTQIDLQ